jgi:hypothetical protein
LKSLISTLSSPCHGAEPEKFIPFTFTPETEEGLESEQQKVITQEMECAKLSAGKKGKEMVKKYFFHSFNRSVNIRK